MSSVKASASLAIYILGAYIDHQRDVDHAVQQLPDEVTLGVVLEIYGGGQAEQTVEAMAALLDDEKPDMRRVGLIVRYVQVAIAIGYLGGVFDFAGAVRALRRRVAAAA